MSQTRHSQAPLALHSYCYCEYYYYCCCYSYSYYYHYFSIAKPARVLKRAHARPLPCCAVTVLRGHTACA
eukprot:576509-Rhodomonas_salina.1